MNLNKRVNGMTVNTQFQKVRVCKTSICSHVLTATEWSVSIAKIRNRKKKQEILTLDAFAGFLSKRSDGQIEDLIPKRQWNKDPKNKRNHLNEQSVSNLASNNILNW